MFDSIALPIQRASLLLVAVILAVPALAAESDHTTRVVEWRFDQLSPDGKLTADAGGGRLHLQIHGGAELVPIQNGKALRLEGDAAWAQGPTMASLGIGHAADTNKLLDGQAVGLKQPGATASLLFEARVRPLRLMGNQVIIECYEKHGDQRSFSLGLSDDRAVFAFSGDGTLRDSLDSGLYSDLRLKPDVWNDVCVRYDGKFVRFQINGEQDTARAYCPGFFAADRPIQVGRRYDGKEASDYFHGDIDLIRLSRIAAESPAIAEPPALAPNARNNFVQDLLTMPQAETGVYEFTMPAAGWTFFEVAGTSATIELDASRSITLDAETHHRAMIRLPQGEHRLQLTIRAGGSASLIVRKVPEMMYVRFGYGSYDWQSLSENVLQYANVCVSGQPPVKVSAGSTRWYVPQFRADVMNQRVDDSDAIIAAWKASGREWIVEMSSRYWKGEDAWRDALAFWREGYTGQLDGSLVDEFGYYYSNQAYRYWTGHVAKLHEADPGGRFYAYCFGLERFPSNHVFLSEVLGTDGRIVWERYLREQPDEESARRALQTLLVDPMAIATQLWPDLPKQLVLCPSTWTGIGQFTDDYYFDVDQKVFLDMQFQVLATDPAFRGLAGIGPWSSGYASPEMIRWVGALYRHYGVQGNTELLSSKYGYTYNLDYLDGPGFEKQQSLYFEPAVDGSLEVRRITDLPEPIAVPDSSYVQPLGEQCLLFSTSDVAPNRVRQKIARLEPGKLYSVQFYTIDLDQPCEQPDRPIPFMLDVEGGKLRPALEERLVIASTRPGHKYVFVSRYSYVFQATGSAAELVLSDWTGDVADPSRVGRHVICDNLAVQPYFSQELFDEGQGTSISTEE